MRSNRCLIATLSESSRPFNSSKTLFRTRLSVTLNAFLLEVTFILPRASSFKVLRSIAPIFSPHKKQAVLKSKRCTFGGRKITGCTDGGVTREWAFIDLVDP